MEVCGPSRPKRNLSDKETTGLLKLTSLRHANVPPPMASYEKCLSSPAMDVALSPKGNLVAVLHRDALEVFRWNPKGKQVIGRELHARLDTAHLVSDQCPQQIAFLDESNIFVSSSGPTGSTVARFLLDQQDLKYVDHVYMSDAPVLRLFSMADRSSVCVENSSGIVREIWSSNNPSAADIARFPEPAPLVDGIQVHGRVSGDNHLCSLNDG